MPLVQRRLKFVIEKCGLIGGTVAGAAIGVLTPGYRLFCGGSFTFPTSDLYD